MQGESHNNFRRLKTWTLVAFVCIGLTWNYNGASRRFFDIHQAQASEPNAQQQSAYSTRAALTNPTTTNGAATAARDSDEFSSTREPGFSPVELDVVRTQDGKLQIRSVDVHSRYASKVKQNQVFNSWSEIWAAIDNE